MHVTRRLAILLGVVLAFMAAASGPAMTPPWTTQPRDTGGLFGFTLLASICLLVAFTPRRTLRATGPLAPRRPGWWRADGIVPLMVMAVLMRLTWIVASIEITDGLAEGLLDGLHDASLPMATRATLILADAVVVALLAAVCRAAGRPRIFALLPALVPVSVFGTLSEPSAAPVAMLLAMLAVLRWIDRPTGWAWTLILLPATVLAPVAGLLVPACLARGRFRLDGWLRIGMAAVAAGAGLVFSVEPIVRQLAGRAARPPWTVSGQLLAIPWSDFAVLSATIALCILLFVVRCVARRSRRPAMLLATTREDTNGDGTERVTVAPRDVRTAMGAFGIFAGATWLLGLTPGTGAAAWAALAIPVMPSAMACAAIALPLSRAGELTTTRWSSQLEPSAMVRLLPIAGLIAGLIIDGPRVNFRRWRRERPRRNPAAVQAVLSRLEPADWPRCLRCRQPLAPAGGDRCPECGTVARAEMHRRPSPFSGADGMLVIGWGMTIVSAATAILLRVMTVAWTSAVNPFTFAAPGPSWTEVLIGLMIPFAALLAGVAIVLALRHPTARTWLWHRSPLRRRVLVTLGFAYAGFGILQTAMFLLLYR